MSMGDIFAVGALLLVPAIPLICLTRFIAAIFFPSLRATIRKEWRYHVLLVATSAAIIVPFTSIGWVSQRQLRGARIAKSQNEVTQLQTAILAYNTEYGELPSSSDNATLIKILTGKNQRGIAFIMPSPREVNAKGEMVDAWQRPFRFSFADPDHPAVISDPPPAR